MYIQDLDHDTALKTVKRLLSIEETEATSSISWMVIYFAFYRENQFKQLGSFKPDDFRSLLKDKLANGSEHFRAPTADHFAGILGRDEIEFETLVPYLEAMVNGPSNRVVNHRLYQIAIKQGADHPGLVGHLIELAVLGELKTLDSGGRDVWHSKEFSEALHAVEQAGPEHKERITRIRKSIQPYEERGRIYGVGDF